MRETGTGKPSPLLKPYLNYVCILDLKKFIILVPSVAIREETKRT
jgi:restriction endonuclease